MSRWRDSSGQAAVLLVGALLAVVIGALILGGVAAGIGAKGTRQRAADLGALAGARAMQNAYDGLFVVPGLGGVSPAHLEVAQYLARARAAAVAVSRANGARDVVVAFPDAAELAPVRIRVTVGDPIEVGGHRRLASSAVAEAELVPAAGGLMGWATGGGYSGPLAYRQGKPMRPDVAIAFDRMAAAAAGAGVSLIVASGFRSDAEQARLFAAHPDPKWVAPPGQSLHRLATELDLGPPGAYGWLYANAGRFGFLKRYSWEPWHFGYIRNAGSASVGFTGPPGSRHGSDGKGAIANFVPARFMPAISRAAQRWSVGAALLSAQLYAESSFNPFAVSSAGAQGIAQFMPGTARSYGLSNSFDVNAAIDAQAHLMHDLLRQFGSVPLALAAYNAGPGAVSRCGCIPPYPETRGYVARILGLLRGAGDSAGLNAGGSTIRLVK